MNPESQIPPTVERISDWFTTPPNARDLPWRPPTPVRDPYHALVSEIMLQQTQVERVIEKFGEFLQKFPTVRALADAPQSEVLAAWTGLGYYARARNLHEAAQQIVEQFGGVIPTTAAELRTLKGVGRYTAGAIASIVYHQPEPIVDGNVARVLARLGGFDAAHGSPELFQWAWSRAHELARAAGPERIAAFNEGLMELGATVCTPAPTQPACENCPLKDLCIARAQNRQMEIPAPKERARRQVIHCASAYIEDGARGLLMQQRPATGMWAQMWQLPTLERAGRSIGKAEVSRWLCAQRLRIRDRFTFLATHRELRFTVWEGQEAMEPDGCVWVAREKLAQLAMSSPQRRAAGLGAITE